MGYGTRDIDLTGSQLSLYWKLAPSYPRCRTKLQVLGCFSDQTTEGTQRDNEKDISDVSLLGASHMMHLWELWDRGYDGCHDFEGEDNKVREQTMESLKVL